MIEDRGYGFRVPAFSASRNDEVASVFASLASLSQCCIPWHDPRMGGDRSFWLFFGGIFLAVGVAFISGRRVNLFADPTQLDGAPSWVFALAGLASGFRLILRRTLLDRAREKRLMKEGMAVRDRHRRAPQPY